MFLDLFECKRCKEIKNRNEFDKRPSTKKGIKSYCKPCELERRSQRRKRIRELLAEFKSQLKCSHCPEDHIATLEFHHTDPSEKEFGISEALSKGLSFDRIKKEIDKCLVLCSNCHAKLHHEERINDRNKND